MANRQYRQWFPAPKENPVNIAPVIGLNFKTPTALDREVLLPTPGSRMSAYGVPLVPVKRPITYK